MMVQQTRTLLGVFVIRTGAVALLIFTASYAHAEGPAGIVLYCRHGQNVFLLLADHAKHTRGWSSFGGGAHPGETKRATAARETEEETRGYFSRAWLMQQISEQKPARSKGYGMYFVEVLFVPAQRVMNNPINEKDKAMKERRCYAWMPFSEIKVMLDEKTLSTEGLLVNPLYLPLCSKSDSFWRVWIDHMYDAMEQGVLPW